MHMLALIPSENKGQRKHVFCKSVFCACHWSHVFALSRDWLIPVITVIDTDATLVGKPSNNYSPNCADITLLDTTLFLSFSLPLVISGKSLLLE